MPIVPCPDCGRNVVTYVARRGQNAGQRFYKCWNHNGADAISTGGKRRTRRMWRLLDKQHLQSGKSGQCRCKAGRRMELKLCRRLTFSRGSKTERRRRAGCIFCKRGRRIHACGGSSCGSSGSRSVSKLLLRAGTMGFSSSAVELLLHACCRRSYRPSIPIWPLAFYLLNPVNKKAFMYTDKCFRSHCTPRTN
uniref:Zinc finger GRF-type domain-containing protein n=1 Tax=Aegilops tauschii subsp. strangulata TaxID=200361 RepID=A0A453B2L0_AEGTS